MQTRSRLVQRVDSLQQMVGQLRLLHESVDRFGQLLHPSANLAPLADRLYQALETLLLTAHDAFRERDPDQVETLRTMTQDRRGVMSRLRASYFEAQTGLAEDERVFLFELTNTFTR